jgi:hypothetical protein
MSMDEVNDQAPTGSQPASTPAPAAPAKGPTVIKKEAPADQAPKGQSENPESKPELYELPDGRMVDAKTLSKEWKENFYPEFTKRSQSLSKLEQERTKWEEGARKDIATTMSENELLKDVPSNVREAVIQIAIPEVEKLLAKRDADTQKKAQDEAFTNRLDELDKKYPGGNGLPKFDRVKVLAAMQEPGNGIFDPEWKFRQLHEPDFMDFAIKQAMKGKSGDVTTESTGSSQPRKPESKPAKTWGEAAKNALSRVTSGE